MFLAVETTTAEILTPHQNLAPLPVPLWGGEQLAAPILRVVPVNRHTADAGAQPYGHCQFIMSSTPRWGAPNFPKHSCLSKF